MVCCVTAEVWSVWYITAMMCCVLQVDGAGRALAVLYPDASSSSSSSSTSSAGSEQHRVKDQTRLFSFDQTPYFEGGCTSLDSSGFVYVPQQCQDGSTVCRLHMSYHGES